MHICSLHAACLQGSAQDWQLPWSGPQLLPWGFLILHHNDNGANDIAPLNGKMHLAMDMHPTQAALPKSLWATACATWTYHSSTPSTTLVGGFKASPWPIIPLTYLALAMPTGLSVSISNEAACCVIPNFDPLRMDAFTYIAI